MHCSDFGTYEIARVYPFGYIPSSCKKVDLIWNRFGHTNVSGTIVIYLLISWWSILFRLLSNSLAYSFFDYYWIPRFKINCNFMKCAWRKLLTPLWITLRFQADDFPFRLCFFTMNVWVKEVPYVFSSLFGRTQIERLFKSPTNKDAFHLHDLKFNMDFNFVGCIQDHLVSFWRSGTQALKINLSFYIPLNK